MPREEIVSMRKDDLKKEIFDDGIFIGAISIILDEIGIPKTAVYVNESFLEDVRMSASLKRAIGRALTNLNEEISRILYWDEREELR